MPQWVSKKTDRLSEIMDAGSAAGLEAPLSGDATSSEVVIGTDSRLSDERIWVPVDLSGQSVVNHTANTLDLGEGLSLHPGCAIAYQQTGDTMWRYAYLEDYSAGVATMIGEAAVTATALITLKTTRLVEWPLYHFNAGINGASTDLYLDEHQQTDIWSGGPAVLLGLQARLALADATSGSDLNAKINGGSDVFSAGMTLDSIWTDTGVDVQAANNRIVKGDTVAITNTAPGAGDQSKLHVKALICPFIQE